MGLVLFVATLELEIRKELFCCFSTRFFTFFDKLEMLVLSTAGGTQHRSHINNTFLLVIYVFSML